LDETTEPYCGEESFKGTKADEILEMSGNIYQDLVKVFYTNL